MYSITPFIGPSDASFTLLHTSSYVAALFSLTLRSTTETSAVGTLYAIPVIFPLSDGITSATAFAAPVVVGIMLPKEALPVLQSFMFRYEASVGGGIPILNAITTVLKANKYEEVLGILNGTTNYILTQMTDYGLEYDDVLKIAQEKGFAEADPTADVEGIDCANKLSILMALTFGNYVPPTEIPREGISGITKQNIKNAKAKGCKIKLISSAKKVGDHIEYSVKPMELPDSHPLASVSNEFNAIFIKGNAVGELMFYGKGAGPLPTGSAIMGDVLEIAKIYGAHGSSPS